MRRRGLRRIAAGAPRALATALCLLLLGGCGLGGLKDRIAGYLGDDSDTIPPSPLVEFDPTLSVERMWSTGAGKGAHKRFLKLRPAVTEQGVFAADRKGRVYAIAPGSGDRIWEHDTDLVITGGPGHGDGLVLVGSSDGVVVALSAKDGTEQWRARVSSEVLSAPIARNDIVVVRTGDGKLFGLSAATGTQIWIYDRSVPVLSLRGNSPPAVVGDLVIAGFDSGRMVALELFTGRLVWETAVAVPRGRSDLERMVDIDAAPQVVDDTIYVATFQGRVAALDISSGETQWSREISSFAGLDVDDRNVYVTDEQSHVWALDRLTGTSLWKQESLERRHASAPVALGEYVVVGDLEGYLHWMNREDGEFVSRVRLDATRIIAAPIVFGETLLAFGANGALAAYRTP